MKKVKTILLTAICAVICLSFAACDFAGYDDDDVIAKSSSFSSTVSVENKGLSSYSFTANKADGVKRIKVKNHATFKVPENPTFNLTLSLEGGRCKIVLVNKDKEVFKICEGNTVASVSMTLAAGTYDLRLVAEAAVKVKFTFQYDGYGG